VVVVGASAGGVEALREFVAGLPSHVPACILIVLHLSPEGGSALPAILRRASRLPVHQAAEGNPLTPGTVIVAPPDRHLLVVDGSVSLGRGPRENGHRPAIDVLFRSAARAHGNRVAGVVLSGTLDDGAAGAATIAARGGHVLVQDLDEAIYSGMPRAALQSTPSALQATVGSMGKLVAEWATQAPTARRTSQTASSVTALEVGLARLDPEAMHQHDRPGTPAGFGCPDCAGSLFQIDEDGVRRYRCRVGHAWSSETLVTRQSEATEGALWMALRSLEERAALNRQLARRAQQGGHESTAVRFSEAATEALHAAELVRRLIDDVGDLPEPVNGA
jgi:two-component system chemotaxis response regulator CheB